MNIGDLYRWFRVFPDKESELAILVGKKIVEEDSWAYQFHFIIRCEKYWFRDTELFYAKRITKEKRCQ
jgi:hypothetical protein